MEEKDLYLVQWGYSPNDEKETPYVLVADSNSNPRSLEQEIVNYHRDRGASNSAWAKVKLIEVKGYNIRLEAKVKE
nr:hypothetical protein [Candidatus Woesearchaeota archaeon]